MNPVLFTFRGLCTFIEEIDAKNVSSYHTYLLPGDTSGHHPPHEAVLVARIRSIEVSPKSTTWLPDLVGYEIGGEQIGIWNLSNVELTTPTLPMTPVVTFTNRSADGIDLSSIHKKQGDTLSAKKSPGTLKAEGAAYLKIMAGKLRCAKPESFTVFQNGKPVSGLKPQLAAAIEWETPDVDVLDLQKNGKEIIRFKENAQVSISNVAKVSISMSKKLPHFAHYYDVLTAPPGSAVKLEVQQLHADVYDCVPPTPGP